ncbi:MAG: hypothetical protein DI570_22075, partial [Phenylobacterium zucineum]
WIQAAPAASPARLDPFHVFGHYPTDTLAPDSRIAAAPGATLADLEHALAQGIFGSMAFDIGRAKLIFSAYQSGEATIAETAAATQTTLPPTGRITGFLLKLGLVVVR